MSVAHGQAWPSPSSSSLAALALPAARRYARVAPSSAHALHMPSHIFTRLGMWPASIQSNLASAAAAKQQVAKTQPGDSRQVKDTHGPIFLLEHF